MVLGSSEDTANLQEFQCERCGYRYKKINDYAPFLCYRCMRFIAKRVYAIMQQIQPTVSRPTVGDV